MRQGIRLGCKNKCDMNGSAGSFLLLAQLKRWKQHSDVELFEVCFTEHIVVWISFTSV